MKTMSQVEKLRQRFDAEKLKGLVDIKFTFSDIKNADLELVCAEINQMFDAPSVIDGELF